MVFGFQPRVLRTGNVIDPAATGPGEHRKPLAATQPQHMPWWRQPAGFAMVGLAGFATDAALFVLLTQGAGLAVFPSRALAFAPATLVTWLLNRRLVFRTSGGPGRKRDEYLRHVGVQSIGIGLNFAAFYAAVRWGLGVHSAQLVPLVIGSLFGMVFNFLASRRFVYLG